MTLALLLTAATGAWADSGEIVVTVTAADLQADLSNPFTKDGVTIKCSDRMHEGLAFNELNEMSTTLGYFTKIEITNQFPEGISGINGVNGFSVNGSVATWTGKASSVGMGHYSVGPVEQFVFTIEPAIDVTPVRGKTNEWTFTMPAYDVEVGAMKPDGAPIDVQTPLALLDDYALMNAMKENYEAKKVTAKATAPERFWTFSSGVDVLVPEGVTVYRAFMQDGAIRTLPIDEANTDGIILANNGVLLSCNSLTGGAVYTFVANPGNQQSGTTPATTDACSYEGNSMVPTIVDTNYPTGRYYILNNNEFHTMSANGEVPACKAVFSVAK